MEIDDTADSLYPLLEIIRKHWAKVISIFSMDEQVPEGRRCCVRGSSVKELGLLIQNTKEQFPIAFKAGS